MPLQATSGAASYDGFGGGVAAVPAYIEEVFSTYLYTGTGAAQTITNGIDLATKGGLVWTKSRNTADYEHNLVCNDVGLGKWLKSNTTEIAQSFAPNGYSLPVFNTTGVTLSDSADQATSPFNYVSWTFRKQPKFFDVVTYTGTGSARTVAHSLGAVPGSIIIKRTNAVSDWAVYHRSLANTEYLVLNSTAAKATGATWWNSTTPTSTVFSVGTDASVNASGGTYVAYLFAHDAGGFGLTGTDNVISCGSYTGSSSDVSINLGYEAQWILVKNTSRAGTNWQMLDVMRGMPLAGTALSLAPNLADAESALTAPVIVPTATGMTITGGLGFSINYNGDSYIYIAIRRGPMKVPTLGTSVLELQNLDNLSVNTLVSSTVVPDMALHVHNLGGRYVVSRLTGGINTASSSSTSPRRWMLTSDTSAEDTGTTGLYYEMQNASFRLAGNGADPGSSLNLAYFFRRAPGFFDVVCYSGTGTAGQTYTHNLGVVPELMIVKGRSIAEEWNVYFGNNTNYLKLNRTDVPQTATTRWNDTSPTSSVFSVGTSNWVNGSGSTYVAYLFATLAGVSKVFSYTGNGSSQTINCGFTGGARFVLIKRTDSTGDWYVWDSARGIVAGNDPHLSLNTTAAEVTTDDSVDTDTTGFIVNQVAATNVNVSSATYIGLAIA